MHPNAHGEATNLRRRTSRSIRHLLLLPPAAALDHSRVRDDFVAITAEKLYEHRGICSGFVVMPNHIHAKTTSIRLKRVLRGVAPHYAAEIPHTEPFWQPKYYPFNLFTARKAVEKLDYMHLNPVRAGLVARAADWPWSSARYYESGGDVGIPLEWIFGD